MGWRLDVGAPLLLVLLTFFYLILQLLLSYVIRSFVCVITCCGAAVLVIPVMGSALTWAVFICGGSAMLG